MIEALKINYIYMYSILITMLWQILMSVIFALILVTSMLSVRIISMEAMNAGATVVTVAMDGYAMVM